MTTSTTSPNTVGSLEDTLQRAGGVPPLDYFPGIDELTARFAALEQRHPQLITSRRVATSRLGEPIRMFTIGTGPLSSLIVGGVHPNEPIGAWTAVHLAEQLLTDDLLRVHSQMTWNIIPCIDPDGARLNEGWFAAPGDRNFYARRFYRPAPDNQVEWTFPTSYKDVYFDRVLSETQGLIRVIDQLKPDLYVSLHNGEMGGVYYYLSRPEPELYHALHAVPESLGLPLDTGEPESPFLKQYAAAIFGTGQISDAYDYLEGLGLDAAAMISGSASSEYAARYGTLSMVAELPYWSHPNANDPTERNESYAQLVHRSAAGMRHTAEVLGAILKRAEPMLSLDTPFLSASRAFVPMLGKIAETDDARASLPSAERPSTVAEQFGCEDIVYCFRLRYGGMLLRALEAEATAGIAPAQLRGITIELAAIYDRWLSEAAAVDTTEVIPINKLVGVQYGAILATVAVLREQKNF